MFYGTKITNFSKQALTQSREAAKERKDQNCKKQTTGFWLFRRFEKFTQPDAESYLFIFAGLCVFAALRQMTHRREQMK
jgi:hypothetical protein